MAYKKQRDGVLMGNTGDIIIVIIDGLKALWDIVTDSRVDDAKKEAHELAAKLSQEANMWQSWFWIAVIVIVILVVIMICKNTDDRE